MRNLMLHVVSRCRRNARRCLMLHIESCAHSNFFVNHALMNEFSHLLNLIGLERGLLMKHVSSCRNSTEIGLCFTKMKHHVEPGAIGCWATVPEAKILLQDGLSCEMTKARSTICCWVMGEFAWSASSERSSMMLDCINGLRDVIVSVVHFHLLVLDLLRSNLSM